MHVSKRFKRHCFVENNLALRNISMSVNVYLCICVNTTKDSFANLKQSNPIPNGDPYQIH